MTTWETNTSCLAINSLNFMMSLEHCLFTATSVHLHPSCCSHSNIHFFISYVMPGLRHDVVIEDRWEKEEYTRVKTTLLKD